MIRLSYSNRTEALLDALVHRLAERRKQADPLEPISIVVPNRNVERFVEMGIAKGLGIAANLKFLRLGELLNMLAGSRDRLLVGGPLRAQVLRGLLDDELLGQMPAVRRYLRGAGDSREAIDRRRGQLVLHLGELFEQYAFSRPELLEGWLAGEYAFANTAQESTERWQAILWNSIRERARELRTIGEVLIDPAPIARKAVHVFGISYVARVFSRAFAVLGERMELDLYTLNPCEEFWEDVETSGELRRRRRHGDAEPIWVLTSEDPFELSVETEQPFLRLWARPGREHVRLLGMLTECDFEPSFVDPAKGSGSRTDLPLFASLGEPTLLELIQSDVLHRAPARETPRLSARDPSLQIVACPNVRREVETVAAEIWSLVREMPDLRFHEIAVLVNGPDRDLYLPHLSAVLEEAHRIPHNIADLSLASSSPIVEGALRLLALPTTRLTRPDVLAAITHPSVRARIPEIDPHDWAVLCDRLGIFHGIDREDHAGTYVEGDHLSWEQGLIRVALGTLMEGDRFVEIGDRYLPQESPPGDRSAPLFGLLVRSLLEDVRFARQSILPLRDWSRFASAMVSSYLEPESDRDLRALRRTIDTIGEIAALDVDGIPISYTLAHTLITSALSELDVGRGQQLADGVVVASLLPMRAIPFRAVFVLGLGEGRFPAPDRRDSMDLRAARRQVGDVTPPERDRYTFLETLLCARERLYLSYVARDEQTGDVLAPSAVVQELLEILERGYLAQAKQRLVRAVPLRRHEDPSITGVIAEAAAEGRTSALGDALHASMGAALTELTPASASRALSSQENLRDVLGLMPLPEPRAIAPTESFLRIRISALRKFLECPLQGWARSSLRLEEDEIDDASARADEPLRPSALDTAVMLREAMADHLLHRVPIDRAYADRAERLQAHGRWPVGSLSRLFASEHREILESWSQSLESLNGTSITRVRFGGAELAGAVERAIDPLVLRFDDDPRAKGSGRPLIVELVGRTELISAGPRSSLWLVMQKPSGQREYPTRLRHALRAFFDHAVLSASGEPADEHRLALLSADDVRPALARFSPFDPADARAWLMELVRSLISERHAYLMPCESILRLADRAELRGEAIVSSIELVRDRWDGGQSRFGPVRDALSYPPPEPGAAEEWALARFGPLLRRLRRGM